MNYPPNNMQKMCHLCDTDNPDYLLSDDMGIWHNNRVDTTYFPARIDEAGVYSVEKLSEPSGRR